MSDFEGQGTSEAGATGHDSGRGGNDYADPMGTNFDYTGNRSPSQQAELENRTNETVGGINNDYEATRVANAFVKGVTAPVPFSGVLSLVTKAAEYFGLQIEKATPPDQNTNDGDWRIPYVPANTSRNFNPSNEDIANALAPSPASFGLPVAPVGNDNSTGTDALSNVGFVAGAGIGAALLALLFL